MNKDDSPLVAESFLQDQRILEAKDLILKTLKDYQQTIQQIKPPNPHRKIDYENFLERFKQARGSALWHPYIGSGIGKGAFVELLDGSVKYDLICGIGPYYLGHSHPIYAVACLEAALSDIVIQGNLQQNYDSLILMEILLKASHMDHCFLASSGVMANENALKIAFQKKFPANRVLAFEKCFFGRTLAAAQITDKPAYREGLPINLFVDYVPFYDPNQSEESTKKALHVLQGHLKRYPNQHALMCFELVQGEAGFYPGSTAFFQALMQTLKEENILILVDEVQTFGRTPSLLATHYYQLQEWVDMISIGKLSHVCATLYKRSLVPKLGLLSQTFTSTTSAIRAATKILQELLNNDYFGSKGRINHLHQQFVDMLERIHQKYPNDLRGPYGLGAMIAFTVYDGSAEKTTQFVKKLFEEGVIAFIAGSSPTRVRFLPPIGVLQENDFKNIEEIIEKTLRSLAHD